LAGYPNVFINNKVVVTRSSLDVAGCCNVCNNTGIWLGILSSLISGWV
jgi:hypothetical protein